MDEVQRDVREVHTTVEGIGVKLDRHLDALAGTLDLDRPDANAVSTRGHLDALDAKLDAALGAAA